MEKIVMFGNTMMAEMMYTYLAHDSEYEVVAFTVDRGYILHEEFIGFPVVAFEDIESRFPPSSFKMILPLSFQKINKFRAGKYAEAKAKGYKLVNYVSSRASTWQDLIIGDNCILLENCVICPHAKIGNDVTIASNAVIGHHVLVEDHSWVSPGAMILGGATIGPYCMIGANATIKETVKVARECLIGMGTSITTNTQERAVYVGASPELLHKSSDELAAWLSWSADPKKPRWGSGKRVP